MPDELKERGEQIVTIGRTGSTPLRFRGVPRLCRTHRSKALVAAIELWKCNAGGTVIHLRLAQDNDYRSFAKRVGSPCDALAFLEALSAEVPQCAMPNLGNGKRSPIESVAEALLVRSRNLDAQSEFMHLTDEIVALLEREWPGPSEKTNPDRLPKNSE